MDLFLCNAMVFRFDFICEEGWSANGADTQVDIELKRHVQEEVSAVPVFAMQELPNLALFPPPVSPVVSRIYS